MCSAVLVLVFDSFLYIRYQFAGQRAVSQVLVDCGIAMIDCKIGVAVSEQALDVNV